MRRSSITPVLSKKLRDIRRWKQLSQTEILSYVFPDADPDMRALVSQWEKSNREPRRQILIRYAALADISLEDLLVDERELPSHITENGDPHKSNYRKKKGRGENLDNNDHILIGREPTTQNDFQGVGNDQNNSRNFVSNENDLDDFENNHEAEEDENNSQREAAHKKEFLSENSPGNQKADSINEPNDQASDNKNTDHKIDKTDSKSEDKICEGCKNSEDEEPEVWEIMDDDPYGRKTEKVCLRLPTRQLDNLHDLYLILQPMLPRIDRKYMSVAIIIEHGIQIIVTDFKNNNEDSFIVGELKKIIDAEEA